MEDYYVQDILSTDVVLLICLITIILIAFVTYLGSKREIGGFYTFLLSFFFSPIVGLIVVLISRKKDDVKLERELLEKMKSKESGSYIDNMYKLKSLYDDGTIDEKTYNEEKEKLELARPVERRLHIYDSKNRGYLLSQGVSVKTTPISDNKQEAIVITTLQNEVKVIVKSKSEFFTPKPLLLEAKTDDNYFDLASII